MCINLDTSYYDQCSSLNDTEGSEYDYHERRPDTVPGRYSTVSDKNVRKDLCFFEERGVQFIVITISCTMDKAGS